MDKILHADDAIFACRRSRLFTLMKVTVVAKWTAMFECNFFNICKYKFN